MKKLIAVKPSIRKPTKDDSYFVIYHTGKASAYYTQKDDKWKFQGGGWAYSSDIIYWYDECN